jgi:ABC-type branched-subunit amino acid transport system permease subunit
MREFNQIACYFIFASMWNLLAGYGGMVSIGQQAYLGFGGYAMLILANYLRRQSVCCHSNRRGPDSAAGHTGLEAGLPPERGIFRDRHLGDRRGVPAFISPTCPSLAAVPAPA